MRDLLKSLSTLSEAETKDTKTGRVHKGDYGNKHGKEEVRDQYGAKIGSVDHDKETKATAPKGRGRPKKGADETGEVKKYDTDTLGDILGGKKPSKEVGTVSKKNSLKEYIDSVQSSLVEGETIEKKGGRVHKGSYGTSYEAGDEGAKKAETNRGRGRPKKDADETGEVKSYDTKSLGNVFGGGKAPKKEVGKVSASHKLKEMNNQVQIKPASQTNTQVIQQGDKTLGTVTNPQLANQIKTAMGQGQLSFNSDEGMSEEVDMGQADAHKSVKSEPKGDWDKDFREKLKQFTKELEQHQAQKHNEEELDEFIDVDTLNQLASHPMAGTLAAAGGAAIGGAIGGAVKKAGDWYANRKEQQAQRNQQTRMAEGKKPDFTDVDDDKNEKESWTKAEKDKANKKKVAESISLSESPETLQHIIGKFKHEVKNFIKGEELDHDLYEALFDYYFNAGEIPYGTAKGRDGDPYEWISDRFDQDVHQYVVDESAARDFRIDGVKPTSDFTRTGTTMAAPSGTPTTANRPVAEPTPWKVDPINAASDRAINFISDLKKKSPFAESTDMKDIQLESWEKKLSGLLTEGITVSSSTGQQGSPDTVTVSASDADAEQLLQVLRQAGVGVFGGETKSSDYGAPMNGVEPEGHGQEPEMSPNVVGDGDDMMALIKKMSGISATGADTYSDYADEEGQDTVTVGTLEPADSEEQSYDDEESSEEQGSEEQSTDDSDDEEEQTDEGNAFTGKLKQTPQGGEFKMGDKEYKDNSSLEEEEEVCETCHMEACECDDTEQVEENFANSANDPAEAELMKLKALLSMGNDMHREKSSQTVGNPTKVAFESALVDWKKLSGIK